MLLRFLRTVGVRGGFHLLTRSPGSPVKTRLDLQDRVSLRSASGCRNGGLGAVWHVRQSYGCLDPSCVDIALRPTLDPQAPHNRSGLTCQPIWAKALQTCTRGTRGGVADRLAGCVQRGRAADADIFRPFSDRERRDELGLGAIRDDVCDGLFPATTLLTSACSQFASQGHQACSTNSTRTVLRMPSGPCLSVFRTPILAAPGKVRLLLEVVLI